MERKTDCVVRVYRRDLRYKTGERLISETRYTFEHWIKEDEYMTTIDRPSHKTQLLTNYHKDLFEIVSREEYTE